MSGTAFAKRTVLITGAASGIGATLARRLAGQGARLVLWDRAVQPLSAVADALRGSGSEVWSAAVDVTDPAAVTQAAESARADAGRVDGLVNCAGIYPVTPLQELSAEEWTRVVTTNLSAPFWVTQAVTQGMIAAGGGGSVVHISSTASRLARPGIAHYGASKAGLNQLTAVQAIELAPHRIRVNAVLPGVIGTERVLSGVQDPDKAAENTAKLARIPLGRLGEPEEVAALAAFLLSEEAAYCTGGLFTVDGGFTLGMPSY